MGRTKTSLKAHNNKKAYKKKTTTTNKQTNKQTKERRNKKNKSNKIIQLLTEAPELVTLDCSFTHVLQAPNTQPYQSLELDGLGLYVRSLLLIDKTMLGQAPLHCFSETKDCRVVMPEN